MATQERIYQNLYERWPSDIVARAKVEEFTGGVVTAKYLANLDSQGKGPEGRIRIGRKVAYRVDKFIEWLETRTQYLV